MNNNFDGFEIMEKLAAVELVDDFLEAIDSDDIKKVVFLLREADVDEESILAVLKELE